MEMYLSNDIIVVKVLICSFNISKNTLHIVLTFSVQLLLSDTRHGE